jgi:hypothetical protein
VVLDGLVVSILSILVGLYAGLLRGGLVRNVALARVEWWSLLVVGVLVPVLVDRIAPAHSVGLVVLALVALIAFTIRNKHLAGMAIVAIGVCANLTVLVLNDGMPVRREALVSAGLASEQEVDHVEISGVQRLERSGDRMVFLADVIPLAATKQVLSIGDLVILVGLANVAANLLTGTRRLQDTGSDDTPNHEGARVRDDVRIDLTVDERPRSRSRARERTIPDFEPIVVEDVAPRRDLAAPTLVGAAT